MPSNLSCPTKEAAMTELRSRYWLAECPDPAGDADMLGIKITERSPGQFVGLPHEPFEVRCWTGDHVSHMARPCTEREYDDAD